MLRNRRRLEKQRETVCCTCVRIDKSASIKTLRSQTVAVSVIEDKLIVGLYRQVGSRSGQVLSRPVLVSSSLCIPGEEEVSSGTLSRDGQSDQDTPSRQQQQQQPGNVVRIVNTI